MYFSKKGNKYFLKKKKKKKLEEESEEELKENKFFKYIENESKGINYDLFKTPTCVAPTILANKYEAKDKNKNNNFVNVIKSGLHDLKDEIEKMSEDEKKI